MAFPHETFLNALWSDDQSAATPCRPGGRGAVGRPCLADRGQLLGPELVRRSRNQPPTFPHPEIVHGQDIFAPKLEDQQHLDRPAPDAARRGQALNDFLIGQFFDLP